jgi:hypothetical protein
MGDYACEVVVKFDWQHIALLALALAGAALCAWRPEAARYAGPILAALIPAALAKLPPTAPPTATVAPPDPPEAP